MIKGIYEKPVSHIIPIGKTGDFSPKMWKEVRMSALIFFFKSLYWKMLASAIRQKWNKI